MRKIVRPRCVVCGSAGTILYVDLEDRHYSAPGKWSFKCCDNAACGTLWLDPAPLPDDLGEAYADYFTHEAKGPPRLSSFKRAYFAATYGEPGKAGIIKRLIAATFALRHRRRLDADNQVGHVQIDRPGIKVLDLGCGDGGIMWVLKQLGCDVVGVEFDDAAAARGRERGLDIRTGGLEEQHFPANSFDAIVLSHVIEHLPDPAGVLNEILRILRPGGQLRMLTPNAAAWGHVHFGRDWYPLEPRHLNIFTPQSLATLVRDAGFSEVIVPTTSTGADRIAVYSQRIRQTGRAGMDEKYGWTEKRRARFLQAWETLLNLGSRGIGSQLVAKARKPLD